MPNSLKCSECGAQMEIGELRPGDKIARCPYCKAVVDLPDDRAVERITEVEEHEQRADADVKRTIRVVERGSMSSSQVPDSGSMAPAGTASVDELLHQAQGMLKNICGDSQAGAPVIENAVTSNVATEKRVETVSFRSGPQAKLPDGVERWLKDMGIASPPSRREEKVPAVKPSWWRRLLGKK